MSVPDTNTFSLQDITTEIYGDTAAGRNLVSCFADATGTFDPSYAGSKDRMSNFRNYTHPTPSSLLTGLVSYWKLDETSDNALDSNDGNDGTVSNLTRGNAGIIGNCYTFSSGLIDFGNPENLKLGATGGISCWINPSSFTGLHSIISCLNVEIDRDGYAVYINDDWIVGEIDTDSVSAYASNYQLPDLYTWYHIVVTWDATTLYLYVDSVNRSSSSSVVPNTGVYNLYIGKDPGANSYYFSGSIDEVGIWNRLLTSDEVVTLYGLGSGLAYPF
jgi:hypothetical protein